MAQCDQRGSTDLRVADEPRFQHASVEVSAPVNCLSIDVEGFVEASLESVLVPVGAVDAGREAPGIERNVGSLLDLLADEEQRVKGRLRALGYID